MKFWTVFLLLLSVACEPKGTLTESSATTPQTVETKALDILSRRCATCHGPNSSGLGGINFITNPQALVDRKIIEPGNPENSLLIQVVQSNRMPLSGPALTSDEKNSLAEWIKSF